MVRFSGSNEVTSDWLIEVAKGNVTGYSIVNKFGHNPDIDAGVITDIWDYGGLYTYPTVAAVNYISSDNILDTQIITVEGLDANWEFQRVNVVLDGQNKTQIGTTETWMRVFKAYNSDSTEFSGTVYIYENDTVVLGVPQTDAAIKAFLSTTAQQTEMALYTIPANKTGYLIQKRWSLNDSGSTRAIVTMMVREFGGIFRSKGLNALKNSGVSLIEIDYPLPLVIPEKSDILMRCRETTSNNTGITGHFSILLVDT